MWRTGILLTVDTVSYTHLDVYKRQPTQEPQVLGICLIHDPKGVYYGGTIAAPVIRDIFDNILPYMGIQG